MLSEVMENRIEEISAISDELSNILPRYGWNSYTRKLVERLRNVYSAIESDDAREDGMLDAFRDAWITTENNHKIHIGDDGNPDKGNPHVLEVIEGAMKSAESKQRKGDMRCEKPVKFEKPGSITSAKDGRKIFHFSHDENNMSLSKQINVRDESGSNYKICRGNIEHLTVFAASDMDRGVDVAEKLSEQFGGEAKSWKHVKGIGTIVDKDGKQGKADLHWFESPECGQVLFKVKQFLEDMDESQIYW